MLTEVRVLCLSVTVLRFFPRHDGLLSSWPAVFTSAPETDGDRSATNVTDIHSRCWFFQLRNHMPRKRTF